MPARDRRTATKVSRVHDVLGLVLCWSSASVATLCALLSLWYGSLAWENRDYVMAIVILALSCGSAAAFWVAALRRREPQAVPYFLAGVIGIGVWVALVLNS